MKKGHEQYRGIASLLIVATFVFIGFKYCNEPEEPKETAADYFVSEHFKANVVAPRTDQQSKIIEMALQERIKHPDKEGGTVRFFENSTDTTRPGAAWAYVEYHYPLKPEKENAKDNYGNSVEVKIIK
jgi:hypothetical protein